MIDVMTQLMAFILIILIFVVFPILGIWYSIKLSQRQACKRDKMLQSLLGNEITIERGFPIPQETEKVVQGGLRNTLQRYRELIIADKWLFIQVSSTLPALTLFEDRNLTGLSLYACELQQFTPTIAIKNNKNKSFLARYIQQDITAGKLIWCEAGFDKDHDIYNEPGSQVDTLSILSPEVLEILQTSPANADILLKRNQLYYLLPGTFTAEKILPDIIRHSSRLALGLEENLARWARSSSNTQKIDEIKTNDLSVTLREKYERGNA